MKLVILGAPGAGKGTQAGLIADRLGIPTISTGNLLRAAMQQGTQIGQKVHSYMESGKLVPDELVIDLVRERVGQSDCQKGYVLDGFPRTLPQAKALSSFAQIDAALSIEVSDEWKGGASAPNVRRLTMWKITPRKWRAYATAAAARWP